MQDRIRLVSLVALAALCTPALGQSAETWDFELTPYLWAAGISGDVEVGNLPSQDVDVSFGDILEDLSMAGMLGFEARKAASDVALLADLLYIRIEDERTNADVELEELMGELDVAFRPLDARWLELLAGLRYWSVDGDVDPIGPPSASNTEDWVDPIVGARATFHPFGPRWRSQWRGDFGGFDVGSKSTYQLSGDLQYAFGESWSATLGYRLLGFDYEASRGDYDLTMYGPWIGVTWRF